jgi:hypothetical protein
MGITSLIAPFEMDDQADDAHAMMPMQTTGGPPWDISDSCAGSPAAVIHALC